MKRCLELEVFFPLKLTLNRLGKKEVSPVPFNENAVSHFNKEIKIFVTPNQYFEAKFRGIFTGTKTQHSSGIESKRLLAGPNMSYWPWQLNFAVWCTTKSCGISCEVLYKVPEQIKLFVMFRIYFTVRRILFEMSGIQSELAHHGDPTFCHINYYDTSLFKRICAAFGISPSTDFPFKCGDNHRIQNSFIQPTCIVEEKISAIRVEKPPKEW